VLTVLQVAYPFAPVSLDAAGGAEQIMALLDRALTSRGHCSIAIACKGSQTAGVLLPVAANAPVDERARKTTRDAFRDRVAEALAHWRVDVVHMHGVDFFDYLPPSGPAVLATLHLPIDFYPGAIFQPGRTNTYLNCVSGAQLRTCPPCERVIGAIDNGILVDLFPRTIAARGDYALALGRICPEKGFHLALDAAEHAGVPLWLAGPIFPYPEHEEYFSRELLPRLSPPHRYLGPVGFQQKLELLCTARCLVVPSLVAETSSLVAMEAMACGTPVVSFPSGALATLVTHERTGFLVENLQQMASAIARSGEIDGRECRLEAEARFSADRMAEQYFEIYEDLARGNTPRQARADQHPETILLA
jgi:glycosyltransferase involved in cell wall biosynthesis